jgi:hypothetical protein
MKSATVIFCLACALAAATTHAVDLTPKFISRGTVQIPYYTQGSTQYTLYVPPETSVAAEGGTVFYFHQLEEASLVIKTSPLSPALASSGTGREVYLKEARLCLPKGAQDVVLEEGKTPGLAFGDAEALELVYTFKLGARRFLQAVAFTNYSEVQQIAVILTATDESFEKSLSLSRQILRSWRKVKPGEDLSVPPAS